MPATTTIALLYSLCNFPSHKASPLASDSLQQSNSTTCIGAKARPQGFLQKPPFCSPTNARLSIQFKQKILCLEIMGVDAGKALSQNPDLRAASMESIQSIVSFLQSKGILQKDLAKIFGMCPSILTSDIKADLSPVFDFLSQELRVPDHSFRKVINKCPRLLISSVGDQLKPALFYLQRLGFKKLAALAYQDSILLVSNVERTLIPKLKYLEELGFSKGEARDMVLRCPALFTFSIENNFQPKLKYFAIEMGRKLEELKEFPQYFTFSLENRIKPRHMEVVKSGIKLPLPVMMKSTNEEFKELLRQKGGWQYE